MLPQETRVGSPRPRKLSVVSVRIAAATVSVVFANTSGMTLGSTCRRSGACCRRRARVIVPGKARSLIDSVWARISSAVPGQEVTPITRTMLNSDLPSTLASTIASGRNGMTSIHSVNRNRMAPVQPPK